MHARLGHAGLALALGAQFGAPSLQAQERFTLTGRELAIHNLVGTVQIVAGTGSNTEIEVTRSGRDAAQLRIVPGTSTLRVIYPRDEIVYPRMGRGSETTLDVRDDGTFGRGSTGGSRRVRISGTDRASSGALEAAADIVVRVPAGVRLTTHTAVGDAQIRGVNGVTNVNNSSGNITATGVRGELELRTASGNVEANDIDAQLSVRTASGGVTLENVRGSSLSVQVASGGIDATQLRAPTVELKTASGRLRVADIQTERLTLHSASGSVSARSVATDEARLSTASGSIDLDLSRPVRVAELRSASGSVNLRVPEGMGATLELHTTSGGIHVDPPMTVTSSRRGYTTGTIGDGSARISARTTSGSVSVRSR